MRKSAKGKLLVDGVATRNTSRSPKAPATPNGDINHKMIIDRMSRAEEKRAYRNARRAWAQQPIESMNPWTNEKIR